jgi:hypothetical protein
VLTIVLAAVMVRAVADMVAAYTGQARVIDRAINPGQTRASP